VVEEEEEEVVHITQAATGLDLQRGEERSENIHTQDRCMLGCRDMLSGHLKLEKWLIPHLQLRRIKGKDIFILLYLKKLHLLIRSSGAQTTKTTTTALQNIEE